MKIMTKKITNNNYWHLVYLTSKADFKGSKQIEQYSSGLISFEDNIYKKFF